MAEMVPCRSMAASCWLDSRRGVAATSVVRALRTCPVGVTQSFARFLQFFVDEAPAVGVLRHLHELLREMPEEDRCAIYAFGLMRRERALPPALEAQLVADLSSHAQAALTPPEPTTRRRRTP